MQSFNSNNLKNEIGLFIRTWIKQLSENNKNEAFALLDKSEYLIQQNLDYSNLIDLCFSMYDLEKPYPVFTNPDTLDLSKEQLFIYDYEDGSGCAVEYDLPLNGEWSDFTAQFKFKKQTDSLYYIYLEDIHIL